MLYFVCMYVNILIYKINYKQNILISGPLCSHKLLPRINGSICLYQHHQSPTQCRSGLRRALTEPPSISRYGNRRGHPALGGLVGEGRVGEAGVLYPTVHGKVLVSFVSSHLLPLLCALIQLGDHWVIILKSLFDFLYIVKTTSILNLLIQIETNCKL